MLQQVWGCCLDPKRFCYSLQRLDLGLFLTKASHGDGTIIDFTVTDGQNDRDFAN